jgi:hypothetical protein
MEKEWHRPDGRGLERSRAKSRIRWRRNAPMLRRYPRMKNCTTRDGECVLRIAGVTGSPTGGGRTVGGGAETLNIAAVTADAAEYSYSNMMH